MSQCVCLRTCAVERVRAQRREREKHLSASREALLSASEELAEVVVQPSAWTAELRSCSRLYQPVAVGEVSHDAKDLQAEALAEVRSPFAFLSHFCIWNVGSLTTYELKFMSLL